MRLVLSLFPQWQHEEGKVEFIRFTDGITNTVRFPILTGPIHEEPSKNLAKAER